MKKLIWISFDLSVRGDYEGIYSWLDIKNAKECGDSLAAFNFEFPEEGSLLNELKREISENVKLQKRDRIYVIWREEKKMKGRFIFGKRKASPWEGYGPKGDETDIEEG